MDSTPGITSIGNILLLSLDTKVIVLKGLLSVDDKDIMLCSTSNKGLLLTLTECRISAAAAAAGCSLGTVLIMLILDWLKGLIRLPSGSPPGGFLRNRTDVEDIFLKYFKNNQ
jgi:hypothetical protein